MRRRANTTQRGYGSQHQALRRALLPRAYGTPCSRCGLPMLPGQELDLDHDDNDRSLYRGFSHSECNRQAGGRKRHEPRNPQPKGATRW